jgi:hypothetical protein
VPEPVLSATADAALLNQLSGIEARARSGHSKFFAAAALARAAASSAGASGSESWIAAQQALSALVATRAPVTRALAEIDELAAARVQRLGGIAAADLRAIQSAAARVGELDRSEAGLINQLQAQLRR